jgi:hypothetical protein
MKHLVVKMDGFLGQIHKYLQFGQRVHPSPKQTLENVSTETIVEGNNELSSSFFQHFPSFYLFLSPFP